MILLGLSLLVRKLMRLGFLFTLMAEMMGVLLWRGCSIVTVLEDLINWIWRFDSAVFGVGGFVLGWAGPHGLLRLTHPTGLFVIAGLYGRVSLT
jgi:hypothetical protein